MTPAVNRVSWPCTKHEYNHYHQAHCLRSIVGKAKNAELFKEKLLARQLSRLHVSVCPRLHTSIPPCMCVCMFFVLCVQCLQPMMIVCVCVCVWTENVSVVVCLAYQWRPGPDDCYRSALIFPVAVGSPPLAVFKGLSCCLAELT